MLDNFGMGEFLLLAFFALLFFGPERLPQIGAKLGQWLSKLTQYSKAFMTQWNDEALAIQDAVTEVRGIRDEIVAARAEIASTLDTARQDINDTIDDARGTVKQATPSAQRILESAQQPPAGGAAQETKEEGSEDVAITRTQQILDDLRAKRAEPSASAESDEGTPAPDPEGKDEQWDKNYQAIQEIMQRSASRQTEEEQVTEPPEIAPGGSEPEEPPAELVEAEPDEEEKPAESAFDRTQHILDDFLKKKTGTETEPAEPVSTTEEQESPSQPEKVETEEKTESAFDRTQHILDDLLKKKTGAETEPVADTLPAQGKEDVGSPAMPVTAPGQPVYQPQTSVSYSKFVDLSIQVTILKRELKALRGELEFLRDKLPADELALPVTEGESEALPVEEAV